MKRRIFISSIVGAGLMALAAMPASANPFEPRWEGMQADRLPNRAVRSSVEAPRLMAAVKISASRAKSIALRHVPGSTYLDMKLIDGNTYRVRVTKNGRRIDVYVDANTGRVR